MIILIIVFLFFVLVFPLFRCFLSNFHLAAFYSAKDIYFYFKYKKFNDFNYYGIDLFCGMFGKGKTLTMTHRANALYNKYGDSIQFYSNYKLNDIPYIPLINFNQLVDLGEEEGFDKVGTVVLIDEIQTLLNHRNFSNFPLSLLYMLCQQRKRKIYIMCTAQRFAHVDKLFRDITTHVVECNKLWRFSNLKYYDASDYEVASSSSLLRPLANRWWFVRNSDYDLYDTSQMISKSSAEDFRSNDAAIIAQSQSCTINDDSINRKSKTLKRKLKSRR